LDEIAHPDHLVAPLYSDRLCMTFLAITLFPDRKWRAAELNGLQGRNSSPSC
jgi:hypothetical protein